MMKRCLKAALIQMSVGVNRMENLKRAEKMITEASKNGAKLVSLSECFNSPYGTKFFAEYAESIPNGPTSEMLSKAAKANQIYLVGGTIPESSNNKLYNTCTIWNPDGKLIGKFRKMHLFDIDLPGAVPFKESDVLSSGNEFVTFKIPDVNVTAGIGICYDMRFEEMAKFYRLQGCELLIYPGAFTMKTGPLHWELLQRSRANDNQSYVLGISPARGDKGYIAWGHSQITDPWGKVVKQAGPEETIVYGDLDFDECTKIRQQIPIGIQRRSDIYDTIIKDPHKMIS